MTEDSVLCFISSNISKLRRAGTPKGPPPRPRRRAGARPFGPRKAPPGGPGPGPDARLHCGPELVESTPAAIATRTPAGERAGARGRPPGAAAEFGVAACRGG